MNDTPEMVYHSTLTIQNIDKIYSMAVANGDIYNISKYASTNAHEFFADCFTIYEMGKEELPKIYSGNGGKRVKMSCLECFCYEEVPDQCRIGCTEWFDVESGKRQEPPHRCRLVEEIPWPIWNGEETCDTYLDRKMIESMSGGSR